jgi:ubiquinone/menaquinone biosynthesis C-methylase UbiE
MREFAVEIPASYEPFSREPAYIELNAAFVHSIGLGNSRRLLDLACGTGTLTELMILENPTLSVVALDISRDVLMLARRYLVDRKRMVTLVEGSAERLPFTREYFDAVVMGNSIQLVDDKDSLLGEIHRVLGPGGVFAFNTSFYAGTYVPGTERFYLQWVAEACRYIQGKSEELRARGLRAIIREKRLEARAFARPWLSVDDYVCRLERNGFRISSVEERTVLLTQRCFEAIGSYAELAGVLLSGYPVALACEALAKASGPSFAAMQTSVVPRYWLEVVTVRRE